MVRRRELVIAHPGVYVNHTGPLTWEQRAWVAVLACWPAALSTSRPVPGDRGEARSTSPSACGGRCSLQLASSSTGRRTSTHGWTRGSPRRGSIPGTPPSTWRCSGSVSDRFRVFADACQTRDVASLTSVTPSVTSTGAGRALLAALLDDLGTVRARCWSAATSSSSVGTGSRTADRQRADTLAGRRVYRDAPYAEQGLVIELDSRAFHDNASARAGRRARTRHPPSPTRRHDPAHLRAGLRPPLRDDPQGRSVARAPRWPGPFQPCRTVLSARSCVRQPEAIAPVAPSRRPAGRPAPTWTPAEELEHRLAGPAGVGGVLDPDDPGGLVGPRAGGDRRVVRRSR